MRMPLLYESCPKAGVASEALDKNTVGTNTDFQQPGVRDKIREKQATERKTKKRETGKRDDNMLLEALTLNLSFISSWPSLWPLNRSEG